MDEQKVLILDTTLRDGEQTSGVSFTETEKLSLAKILLEEVKVDRLEITSARVSEGEKKAALRILNWAKGTDHLEKIEILGFVDQHASVKWIQEVGGKVMNLLAKGSLKHLKGQLRKTPEAHIESLKETIDYANTLGIHVNLYLEDWSNGMIQSRDYVFQLMDALQDQPILRFMLPDTLGILQPSETALFVSEMTHRYPQLKFDFHAHNDYDLSVANVLEAVKAGASCIHVTVNGLGERAGNAILSSSIAALRDHLQIETNVVETNIYRISKLVETFSGLRIPANKPLIGDNVFTQTCGVHADGDSKDNLYFNTLMPERFGRSRSYALGKTSGKANVKKNLAELGIELDEKTLKKVTDRVIQLGDKKEQITLDDLPYIVADVLDLAEIEQKVKIINYNLSHAKGLKPVASVALMIDGKQYEATSAGDGQYNAFMNALSKIYKDNLKKSLPQLIDYSVLIPPGGKSDALCETTITWEMKREFKTRGVDTDQTFSAIKATEKMLNLLQNETILQITQLQSQFTLA
jgi:D-citramalate synthase|tara:strand:+ start:2062 stop:3630 length:1569 start_codon:yes stop_codon:yes gene_type:complete